ncbi:enoyl-CoA hydratase/isomerase family protein [Nocardioides marmoriginsengisoli]|uniref:Enoyl-CoA hydratase/isomerase family protein n=1 Tax=Nocardioides marmoriginsengisoli TaxID=661483 RepID=A0A3N0CQT4_9ACTN|nr:enoyl-CoA hydratase/isomerase family protein [Nocardioides marmoriginsengisoli]RNL65815.1 enoyl-CoA hydratase/isomerase family protein [Nocardioides marmoriginsengisoli]
MLPSADALAASRLSLSVDGPVATITLNAPDRRNSQVPSMWHSLAAIGAALDDEIRVVVLRGAGSCFSAGLDLGLLSPEGVPGEEHMLGLMNAADQTIIDTIDGYQQGFTWLTDPRFISIAEVHGYAIGAGFQLALACDLRVVAEDAWFCMKEPALGLVPDLAGTKPLVDLVGYSRALEICATARQVSAPEAADLGIATAVVPVAELQATTDDLVQALLANNAGAVRETTALLQSARVEDLDTQRLAERTAQARRFRALAAGG